MILLINIIILIVVLLLCIITHELGHVLYANVFLKKNLDVKISFKEVVIGDKLDYLLMSRKQRILLYSYGILAGMIPILLLSYPYSLLCLSLVLYGSVHDIKCIIDELWVNG